MNNVLSTKVTIYRNLKDFKFENKMDIQQKQTAMDMLNDVLKSKMALLDLKQTDGNVVSALKSNDLIEGNAQYLFLDKKERLTLNLFQGEHLAIVSSCDGYDNSVVDRAISLVQDLSKKINFSYSDEFGYLMSDLNKIGTGIKIESNIMLSAITTINKIEQVKQNVAKLGYILKETKYPAVFTLSTRCNLGLSEKKIFEDFENTLSKLQDLEIESVKMLDATNHDDLVDKTQRSMAILNVAHLLSYEELYNLIVNIRMGINVGLVKMNLQTVNNLQKLVTGKLNDLVSQSELKEVAVKVKEILKGDGNV